MLAERFSRWLRHTEREKQAFLAEVGGSGVDDAAALEIVNRDFPGVVRTEATVRQWVRDDPEFAEALKVAREHRQQARTHEATRTGPLPADQWPFAGVRLDRRDDPFRVYLPPRVSDE